MYIFYVLKQIYTYFCLNFFLCKCTKGSVQVSLHFFIQKKNNFILKKQENYADYEKNFFWIFRIKIYMEKIIFLKKNPPKIALMA